MAYLQLPLVDDPDQVTARLLDALAARLPGWTPREGQLDVALLEEVGRETADLRRLTVDVADAVFRSLGRSLFGVTPHPGAPATLSVRLTVTGAGVVVPAGFSVVGQTPDGESVAFRTAADVTSAATTVDVTMTADEPTARANGVPPGPLTIVTATVGVLAADALTTSSGGLDPESDPAYLDRLTDTLTTLTRSPILPRDYAALARSVEGVDRAFALDGYDPATDTTGHERLVTVVPVDPRGYPVTTAVADEVARVLDAAREVTFLVRVMAPTHVALTVTFRVVPETGADPAATVEAVRQAVLGYLDPGTWGEGSHVPTTVVRFLDLARVAGSAPGVAYLAELTLNGGTTDVTLAGRAPLPAPADHPTAPTTVTGTAA